MNRFKVTLVKAFYILAGDLHFHVQFFPFSLRRSVKMFWSVITVNQVRKKIDLDKGKNC